jgi:hypothetical protein
LNQIARREQEALLHCHYDEFALEVNKNAFSVNTLFLNVWRVRQPLAEQEGVLFFPVFDLGLT